MDVLICLRVKVFIFRHVVFDETSFPSRDNVSHCAPLCKSSSPVIINPPFMQPSKCHPSHAPEPPPTSLPPPSPQPPLPHSIHDPTSPTQDHPPETSVSNPTSAPIPASAPIATVLLSGEASSQPTPQMVTRSQDGTRRQKIYKDYQMNYSTKHLLTAFSATAIQVEPTCFSQANKSPEWPQPIGEEFDALQYNAT